LVLAIKNTRAQRPKFLGRARNKIDARSGCCVPSLSTSILEILL